MSTSTPSTYLAIDLGAGSGRVLAGSFSGSGIQLTEIHRFTSPAFKKDEHLHWDVEAIFSEILEGLNKATQRFGSSIRSISVDTWGVDYGLLGEDDKLLNQPFCYRDMRTKETFKEVRQQFGDEALYSTTGIQFMRLNTIFQLAAEPKLEKAKTLLFIPDLINFWLCGVKANEITIASTSGLLDAKSGEWSQALMQGLKINPELFPKQVSPGEILGTIKPSVGLATGLNPAVKVVVCGAHDTASAVAAIPAEGKDWAFLSSGTWSLLGREIDSPNLSESAMEAKYTNERGVCGKIRFLTNVTGLWILEECRRDWHRNGIACSYDELLNAATAAPAFSAKLDVADPAWLTPGDMVQRVLNTARKQKADFPDQPGPITRLILEGFAFAYRDAWEKLASLTGSKPKTLHIVGGGSQNALLNQMTADALNCTVAAGPVEATGLGNLLAQLIADGQIKSIPEGRALLRNDIKLAIYAPQSSAAWDAV